MYSTECRRSSSARPCCTLARRRTPRPVDPVPTRLRSSGLGLVGNRSWPMGFVIDAGFGLKTGYWPGLGAVDMGEASVYFPIGRESDGMMASSPSREADETRLDPLSAVSETSEARDDSAALFLCPWGWQSGWPPPRSTWLRRPQRGVRRPGPAD